MLTAAEITRPPPEDSDGGRGLSFVYFMPMLLIWMSNLFFSDSTVSGVSCSGRNLRTEA